jgi:hypothetical protein
MGYMNSDKVNSSSKSTSGAEAPSVGSGSDICLTSKPTHDKIGTQSGSAATVTSAGIGCGALLGSVSYHSESVFLAIQPKAPFWSDPNASVKPPTSPSSKLINRTLVIADKESSKPVLKVF